MRDRERQWLSVYVSDEEGKQKACSADCRVKVTRTPPHRRMSYGSVRHRLPLCDRALLPQIQTGADFF